MISQFKKNRMQGRNQHVTIKRTSNGKCQEEEATRKYCPPPKEVLLPRGNLDGLKQCLTVSDKDKGRAEWVPLQLPTGDRLTGG